MSFLTSGMLSKAYMQLTNLRPLLSVWRLRVNCKQFIKMVLRIAFTQHLSSRFWISNVLPSWDIYIPDLYSTRTIFQVPCVPGSNVERDMARTVSYSTQWETSLRVIYIQESALGSMLSCRLPVHLTQPSGCLHLTHRIPQRKISLNAFLMKSYMPGMPLSPRRPFLLLK